MLAVKRKVPVDYSKCNQTVSIYHCVNAAGSVTISKTVINGAFFDFKKNQNVEKTGQKETNSFLLVIPNVEYTEQPVFNGDKVILGELTGTDDITTREQWAAFVPATYANMAVVKYVDPKYWNGAIAHWEAGG